jgi:hypothetical protein
MANGKAMSQTAHNVGAFVGKVSPFSANHSAIKVARAQPRAELSMGISICFPLMFTWLELLLDQSGSRSLSNETAQATLQMMVVLRNHWVRWLHTWLKLKPWSSRTNFWVTGRHSRSPCFHANQNVR